VHPIKCMPKKSSLDAIYSRSPLNARFYDHGFCWVQFFVKFTSWNQHKQTDFVYPIRQIWRETFFNIESALQIAWELCKLHAKGLEELNSKENSYCLKFCFQSAILPSLSNQTTFRCDGTSPNIVFHNYLNGNQIY